MEYKIVTDTTIGGICGQVDKSLIDGWKLYGDPFTFGQYNTPAQAMTKGDYRNKKSK